MKHNQNDTTMSYIVTSINKYNINNSRNIVGLVKVCSGLENVNLIPEPINIDF